MQWKLQGEGDNPFNYIKFTRLWLILKCADQYRHIHMATGNHGYGCEYLVLYLILQFLGTSHQTLQQNFMQETSEGSKTVYRWLESWVGEKYP